MEFDGWFVCNAVRRNMSFKLSNTTGKMKQNEWHKRQESTDTELFISNRPFTINTYRFPRRLKA